ncbi:uncharacterized protein Ecym_7202 [Eremothecium cymbalariae DBVPG|uniref:Major facilitator superfamily (MFS) profile domain-containing protein n=1 Tax=Eremothecium cymbalariae (strain CBS 270.75 / DBVPG 7215 / KCTC 17166 / NRRL Y-17582) TaxID=931890 RepID=G8JW35_ERECY|nr:hypothetical protein Ecym_7202 [Eremothecium cymbalariae DBVPG\
MQVKDIYNASNDVKLLCASVFFRLMSYGLTNQILTLFLKEIGVTEKEIGWFISLTLIGDVLISYFLTWYADHLGRRLVLIYGSMMMVLSGMVFSYFEDTRILLFFAIIGVLSPSSEEVGPFKSIEESMIAHLTPHHQRPEIFGFHSMIGTLGSASGAVFSGLFIHSLQIFYPNMSNLIYYKTMFLVYTCFALIKLFIMLSLSEEVEFDYGQNKPISPTTEPEDETSALLPSSTSRGLSSQTVQTITKLLIVFMTDSLGSGFMSSAWVVYYYATAFHMTALGLGVLFFCTKLITAASNIPSAAIARNFGPVRATLLVQIPSALFLMLIPSAYNLLPLSILFLTLFNFTTDMDVIPRQLLLTTIIDPRDLTKVMGLVNIGKTFARCIGPVFTGLFADKGLLWVCFVISGCLVVLSDLTLAVLYCGIDEQILAKTQNND